MEDNKGEIKFEINIKPGRIVPPIISEIEYRLSGEFSIDPELLSLEIKNELDMFIGKPLNDVSRRMILNKVKRIFDKDSKNEE